VASWQGGERQVRETTRHVVEALALLGSSGAANLLAELDDRWDHDRWWRVRKSEHPTYVHTAGPVITCLHAQSGQDAKVGKPVAARQACTRCGRPLVLALRAPDPRAFFTEGARVFDNRGNLLEESPDNDRIVTAARPCRRPAAGATLPRVKLAAYLRVSTRRQADDGFGLDVQREQIRLWARKHKHRIVAWHTDAGRSGADELSGRPALEAAYASIPDEAGGLVVARLDRLARDLVLQEQLLAELLRHGARLHSTVDAEDRLLEPDVDDDPTRTFIRQVLSAAQQYERALIRLRMDAGKARKRAQGGYAEGRPEYGTKAVGGAKVPDLAQQRVIALARRRRRAGASLRAIAQELEAAGELAPGGGTRWHPNTVAKILARTPSRTRRRAAG
jgi:DNA invertase Pin-like site-specific DNA recombinase